MRTVTKSRLKTHSTTPLRYIERVNLANDPVLGHLAEPLRLEDISHAAMLSPFHFHRVFQALVGVTLADFVKRLRLERALCMMAHSRKNLAKWDSLSGASERLIPALTKDVQKTIVSTCARRLTGPKNTASAALWQKKTSFPSWNRRVRSPGSGPRWALRRFRKS